MGHTTEISKPTDYALRRICFTGKWPLYVRGRLTTEFIVRIHDGTDLCSVVTEESRRRLNLKEGDDVWVMFNSFAVILRVD